MFANNFANGYHCMSVVVNFPTITLETIIDTLNCSWSNERLYKKIGSLNTHLTVLNLCETSTNPEDQLQYYIMNRSVTTAHRDYDLNQEVLHSKSKP